MQLNLGTITAEQNNRIRGIMYKLGIEMEQKITKLDLFFILLDEKELKLFGENKPENFYIEKEKEVSEPENKSFEEWKAICRALYLKNNPGIDDELLETMSIRDANRKMAQQKKTKKDEW